MKIAGVVILYYPDENVSQNIATYSSFVDKLFLLDNTEKNYFSPGIADEKIVYIADQNNKGIAKRLNQAGKLARFNGFDWLLTMDQDSSFNQHDIVRYLECIGACPNKHQVSMFGVNYSSLPLDKINCTSKESLDLITSGSIINLAVWEKLSGFDEKLFIDEVDFEYCLRSRQYGYNTIQFTSVCLNHRLGETVKGRSLKNGKLTSRNIHSAIRMYYMVRNFLYIRKKYHGKFQEILSARKKSLLIRIKNNLLYNKKRLSVITYLLRGVADFKRKKMGCIKSSSAAI